VTLPRKRARGFGPKRRRAEQRELTTAHDDRSSKKEASALAALHGKHGGMSPLNVGVVLAGPSARGAERSTLIRSATRCSPRSLVVRIRPRKLSWPIFKIADEGLAALEAYWRQGGPERIAQAGSGREIAANRGPPHSGNRRADDSAYAVCSYGHPGSCEPGPSELERPARRGRYRIPTERHLTDRDLGRTPAEN
jgi:hypothetical protein